MSNRRLEALALPAGVLGTARRWARRTCVSEYVRPAVVRRALSTLRAASEGFRKIDAASGKTADRKSVFR